MSPACLQHQYGTTCVSDDQTLTSHEAIQEEIQVDHDSRNLSYTHKDQYFAGFDNIVSIDWDKIVEDIIKVEKTIWDTPKMQKLLSEPLGSPVDLTEEEAMEVIRLAYGRRPDLPAGDVYVQGVRDLLGHSLIERLGKSEEKDI